LEYYHTQGENSTPIRGGIMRYNDNKSKEEIIETSKLLYGITLYEQIYKPKQKLSYYLGWDAEKQETIPMEYIEDGNRKYLPIHDEGLEKKAILLPSDTEEYDNTESLNKEINDFIYKYVDISNEHRQKATWYIRLSWILDNLNTIPYLRALGDYGTGKTRYEDVIGGLCYKPMYVGGAVRTPPIYRIIDLWRGTAIFDEFTLSKSDETEDIIKILNNGYQRGKPVIRCSSENYDKVKYFDPFCSKIISSRKQFNDRALESRCITEVMKETDRTDIPIDLTNSFFEEQMTLRNKLLLYRFKTWNKINTEETVKIDFGHIQPRVKQSFLPFTVLFQHDKKILDNFIVEVISFNNKLIEENSTNLDGMIVNSFIEMKKGYFPIITSKDIRNELVNQHGYSEKLNARIVGKHLKALGFVSRAKTIEGKTQRLLEIEDVRLKHLIYRYVLLENQDKTIEEVLNRSQKELDVK